MSESVRVRLERQARSLVGWPNCRCGASDYRHVRNEGPIEFVEPNGMKMPERILYCRHRKVAVALLRAYRAGRARAMPSGSHY